MNAVRPCPACGSGNATQSTQCWICGAALGDRAAAVSNAPAAHPRPSTDVSTDTWKLLGWTSMLLGLGFTSILVGVELALEWPGLLIPYALVVLVTFVALGRTAYVHLKKKPEPDEGAPGGAKPGSVTGADVLRGLALGLTAALAVIAALVLLAVSAMIIFVIICFAALAMAH